MARNTLIILATVLFLSSCTHNETVLIKKVFNDFNEANIAMNGELVYEYSSSETHDYFARILNHALHSDSIEVLTLGLIDKLNVLSARAMLSDEELLSISPKNFMIRLYSPGINPMDDNMARSTRSMQLKNIAINGNKAKAELAPGGRSLPERVFIEFSKENELWKYNYMSIQLFTEQQLLQMLLQNGLSERQLIDFTYSDPSVVKKLIRPIENIWQPIIQQ